jgi:hypothetical protein
MAKVKDESYFQVSGWMINRLGLKGTTLNVYAIIYGFTQDGETEFTGSRQYLCEFTGATKPTIDKSLNELIEKDLIIKQSYSINNVLFNKYKANLDKINNFTGSKETLLGGSKETLPNNIDINNINNKERKKDGNYDEIINSQITNEDLKSTLYEFIKMRKLIKKPMTDRALQLLIGKLHKLANTPDKAIKVLEQSIVNNWQDIYEIKQQYVSKSDVKKVAKTEYTKEQYNDLYDDIDDINI